MVRVEKSLIKKWKLGLAGLVLAGSSYFNSVQAQENYIPKYNTIAHKMLMIEDSADNVSNNTFPTLKTLDNLIDNSKNYILKKENYNESEIKQISLKINSEIKKQIPFLKENKDKDFISSLIYNAIGEENGIPFNLIVDSNFPKNTSVRYSNKNNTLKINMSHGGIDLGEIKTTEEFKNSIYYRNLNEKEIISLVYYKKALESFEKEKKCNDKNFNQTLNYCNKASEINPKLLEAKKIKREIFCFYLNKNKECREEFEKIEQLKNLELYLPKHNTLAHKVLEIEDSGSVNIPFPSLKTLDNLIEQSKNYIQKKENYTKDEIEKISKNIYLSIKKELSEVNSLRKENDICLRHSLIYSAIGEENDIPFHLVILPGSLDMPPHMFIRYKNEFNIETTSGEIRSDEYYIKNFYLIKENLKNTDYLKNLDEKEILSIGYYLRSIENRNYKTSVYNPEEEMKNLNKAIELNKNFVEVYKIKALHYRNAFKVNIDNPKNFKESLENYKKVLEIYPDDIDSHVYKSQIERTIFKNYSETLNCCNQGLKRIEEITNLYPETKEYFKDYLFYAKSDLYFSRSLANKEIGNLKKAEKDMDLSRSYQYRIENPEWGLVHFMYMVNKYRKENIFEY